VLEDEGAVKEEVHTVEHPVNKSDSTVVVPSAGPKSSNVVAREAAPQETQQEEDYNEFAGFWSLRDYEQNAQNTTSEHAAAPAETNQDAQELTGPLLFRELWAAAPRPRKIDLSYWNTAKGEAIGTYPERSREEEGLVFRAGGKRSIHRRVTSFFMQHIYLHVSARHDLSDELCNTLLRHPAVAGQSGIPFKWEEVLNWSWVLLAHSSISVKRLTLLTRQHRAGNLPPVPLWVVMQVLRSANINMESLSELVQLVKNQSSSWKWSAGETMLLTVRLLRHARRTAPGCFDEIIDLFLTLLQHHHSPSSASNRKKICHWCNRVLSLLAIPASLTPFRSMQAQQTAQLALIRYMQEAEPQIPLMREGYRAIAKVQLMHRKTEQEQEWARAKALTWPPWEKQNQMGSVTKPSDYPGKRSRVVKVLERMQETGYAPYDYDLAVRILTGWDTDDSPTIQVRRTTASISIPKPWLPAVKFVGLDHSPLIWSARVEATRTVREAWMCFCAYSAATQGRSQSAKVFHAMFKKLFARTLPHSEDRLVPGDGTEVYPDPELARDRVYIAEEIPSVSDLFSRMIAQKIRPSIRLLVDLLRQESSLQQGLHYVSHAAIEEDKRNILSSPEKHPSSDVADALKALPGDLIKSYVGLLARPHARKKRDKRPLFDGGSGPAFVKLLLESMNVQQVSIWNEYLHSLELHVRSQQPYYHKDGLPAIWALVCDAVSKIHERVPVNFNTFTHVATVAFRMESSSRVGNFHAPSDDPATVAKRLFQRAASTDSNTRRVDLPSQWQRFCTTQRKARFLHSVPTGDAVEAMVWVLACTEDATKDILALLQWARHHHVLITASGHHFSAHNLAAFRAFLEGSWADDEIWETLRDGETIMDSEQRVEAQRMIEELGCWPDDHYMERYLFGLSNKFTRVRNKYRSRVGIACEYKP